MYCAECGNEVEQAGNRPKRFCSDKCKQAAYRNKRNAPTVTDSIVTPPEPVTAGQPRSGVIKSDSTLRDEAYYLDNPTPKQMIDARARRTNPDKLNWGQWMTPDQLHAAGLIANRVPIPGDWDYEGQYQPDIVEATC